MPTKPRNTDTITFSLPPEMAQQLRQVVKEEDRTVSELLGDSGLGILTLHPQAGARRRLQVHADEADAIDTGTSAGIAKLIRTWLCLSIIAFSRTN